MIAEIVYKRATKRRQFVVLNEDIESGAYRDTFREAWEHYRVTSDYVVDEYQKEGLIIKLPRDCFEYLPVDIPVIEIDAAQTATRLKEVFAKCRELSRN